MPAKPIDGRHALYIGWVIGAAMRNGIDVRVLDDEDGDHTDTFEVVIQTLAIPRTCLFVVVPYPPDDWAFGPVDEAAADATTRSANAAPPIGGKGTP